MTNIRYGPNKWCWGLQRQEIREYRWSVEIFIQIFDCSAHAGKYRYLHKIYLLLDWLTFVVVLDVSLLLLAITYSWYRGVGLYLYLYVFLNLYLYLYLYVFLYLYLYLCILIFLLTCICAYLYLCPLVFACCCWQLHILDRGAYALDSPCITTVIRVIWNRAMEKLMMMLIASREKNCPNWPKQNQTIHMTRKYYSGLTWVNWADSSWILMRKE